MKILVTPRSFASTTDKPMELLQEKGYNIIRNNTGKVFTTSKMKELIKDVSGIIVGIDDMSAEVIEQSNKLKVISKYGVGLDNIDIEAAKGAGIAVTNTPAANNDAVADLAFTFIMSLARRIPEADRKARSGNTGKIIGNSVWGKTLGVIGLGKIGRQVVKRAQGFNMNVIGYDVVEDEDFARKYGVKYSDLDNLLCDSDYITIHVPLNEATRGLIGTEELDKVKKEAYIVNTSRGGVIDERALYNALKARKLKGVALDVFESSPHESPLKELDNVILTPHMGAHTVEAIEKMGVQAAQNLIDVLEGREPENIIV